MRGNVIMILLACLVVVVSVFLVVWINGGAQELLALCDRIDEAVREGRFEEAGQHIQALNRLWARDATAWQFVAIHDDMHQISNALIELSYSYQEGEPQVVLRNCQLLRTAISAVMSKELPTLENIF